MVDEAIVRRTRRTLKAANGTAIPIQGEVDLPVCIGEYVTTVRGLVTRHVSEPMLGIDFLVGNNAAWDFEQSVIWMAGRAFSLHSRSNKQLWCRRVVLQESLTVPARSEAIASTKVQCRRIPNEGEADEDWNTESSSMDNGLKVSRTLIPRNVWSNVPVRVLNTREEPIAVKSGKVIAELHPVEVVADDDQRDSGSTVLKQLDEEGSSNNWLRKLVDGVDDSIPESTCLALESILVKYAGVFSTDENDLGRTSIIMHHIDTGNERPVRQPLRRFPPAHVEVISEHVDNMFKQEGRC